MRHDGWYGKVDLQRPKRTLGSGKDDEHMWLGRRGDSGGRNAEMSLDDNPDDNDKANCLYLNLYIYIHTHTRIYLYIYIEIDR